MLSSRSPINRDARAEAAWARSSNNSTASDLAAGCIRGRQRRSLQAIMVDTQVSNSHTAGQTLKQNQRISGESRRQTHSLLRSENTFGINSPNMIVKKVNGTTTSGDCQDRRRGRRQPEPFVQKGLDVLGGPCAADGRGNGPQQRDRHLHGRQAGLHVLLHVEGGLGPGPVLAHQDLEPGDGDGRQGDLIAGKHAVKEHHRHHDAQFDDSHVRAGSVDVGVVV